MTRSRQRVRPTREETRERILDGATEAFAERGFHGASQDDICARVGLTRGAFTSSFKTKDELFFALYDRMMVNIRQRFEQATKAATKKGGSDVSKFFTEFVNHYPIGKNWHLLLTEFSLYAIRNPDAAAHLAKRRGEMLTLISEYLQALISADGQHMTVDIRIFARLLLALHDGNLSQSFVEPDALVPGGLLAEFGPKIVSAFSSK